MNISLNKRSRLASFLIFILAVVVTLILTVAVLKLGNLAIIVPVSILGFAVVLFSFVNAQFGLMTIVLYSFFIAIMNRLFGEEVPLGAAIELMLMVSLGGIIANKILSRDNDWSFLVNPITIMYLIWIGYMIIQLFNPNMHSYTGWLFYLRKIGGTLMAYAIGLYIFQNFKALKIFIHFWLGLAFIAALYGCFQEWVGFLPFEDDWIRASEARFNLIYAGWRFRKFSIMPDPTAFGVHMAATSIFCLILMTGPISRNQRIMYGIAAFFMILGMSYSGTRTAYAMIPAGIAIFSLLTITNRNTIILSSLSVVIFLFILYGPIYGNKVVDRIRSTFSPTKDSSYQVREENRHRIQPYMHRHPIGGGMATSGVVGTIFNPNHELAGFPPDSAYVATALETGWIGLILRMLIYFVVFRVAISSYFKSSNRHIKTYYAGLIGMVFSLVVALYAQQSPIGQLPTSMIFYPVLAMIASMRNFNVDENGKDIPDELNKPVD